MKIMTTEGKRELFSMKAERMEIGMMMMIWTFEKEWRIDWPETQQTFWAFERSCCSATPSAMMMTMMMQMQMHSCPFLEKEMKVEEK